MKGFVVALIRNAEMEATKIICELMPPTIDKS